MDLIKEVQNSQQVSKEFIPYNKDLIKSGFLSFLNDECQLKQSEHNPFVQFEKWFYKYHQACLLTCWTYNKGIKEPYCYIEHYGVFTDLNLLGKRIRNEISSKMIDKFGKIQEEYKTWKPSVDFFCESLHISLPYKEEKDDQLIYWSELQVEYIHLNETNERYGYEGWKFNL